MAETMRIKVSENGPYVVTGNVPLTGQTIGTDAQGESVEWIEGQSLETRPRYLLCRCGNSANKPFCDGTHAKAGFDGTETASHAPYLDQARSLEGPTVVLTDAVHLCASARFCDPNGTVWRQVNHTDNPEVRAQFEHQVGLCPSGRLVAWDKETGQPVEPQHAPSIGLVQDPVQGVSGPIWVRGGIEVVSADGQPYPVRNRQTLCRCGASANKPFCDGSHIRVRFRDDKSSPV